MVRLERVKGERIWIALVPEYRGQPRKHPLPAIITKLSNEFIYFGWLI
jgi:hypothetical protein